MNSSLYRQQSNEMAIHLRPAIFGRDSGELLFVHFGAWGPFRGL